MKTVYERISQVEINYSHPQNNEPCQITLTDGRKIGIGFGPLIHDVVSHVSEEKIVNLKSENCSYEKFLSRFMTVEKLIEMDSAWKNFKPEVVLKTMFN